MACPLPLPPKWARYYHVWQMEWDSDFIEVRIDGETILKALDVKMGKNLTWILLTERHWQICEVDLRIWGSTGVFFFLQWNLCVIPGYL